MKCARRPSTPAAGTRTEAENGLCTTRRGPRAECPEPCEGPQTAVARARSALSQHLHAEPRHALPGPLSSVTSSASPGFRRAGVLRPSRPCPRTISTHLHCLCHPCQHQDCASHPPRLSAEPERGEKEFKQNYFDGMFKKEIEGKMYLLQ